MSVDCVGGGHHKLGFSMGALASLTSGSCIRGSFATYLSYMAGPCPWARKGTCGERMAWTGPSFLSLAFPSNLGWNHRAGTSFPYMVPIDDVTLRMVAG